LFWKNKNKEDLPNEIWVDAYGFDGIYEVSNKGRIRSLDRLINHPNGERMMKGRVLSQCRVIHKYSGSFSLYVRLANGNATYSNKTLAALVLNSFKKPDKYNDCTHHINGISHDNRLENLGFEDLHTKRRIEFDSDLRDGDKNTKHWKESGLLKQRAKAFDKVRAKRKGNRAKTFEKRNKKPVTVFTTKDNFIGTYTCLRNASEQLGIKEYTLRNALLKPKKYQYIQVKEGIYNIEDFKPKPKKKENKIYFGNDKYGFMQFSEKFNIPSTTLYYKFRTLNETDFIKWVGEKTFNMVKLAEISIEK
jgi:hypothetical protein